MLDSKPDLDQHLLVAMLAAVFGGADRDRTGDPLLAKQVLSQLSYSPILVVGCQFSVVSRFSDN